MSTKVRETFQEQYEKVERLISDSKTLADIKLCKVLIDVVKPVWSLFECHEMCSDIWLCFTVKLSNMIFNEMNEGRRKGLVKYSREVLK